MKLPASTVYCMSKDCFTLSSPLEAFDCVWMSIFGHHLNWNLLNFEINQFTLRCLCLDYLGGPYATFGGKDASRGLATFSVTTKEVEYDDLSDLTPPEMDSIREWEMQFKGERRKNYRSLANLTLPLLFRKIWIGWTFVESKSRLRKFCLSFWTWPWFYF